MSQQTEQVVRTPLQPWGRLLTILWGTAQPWYWLNFLCLSLVGYALLGRGWAYLGVPPVYVGEVVLEYGLISALLFARWREITSVGPFCVLLALTGWCLCRTLPYVSTYGTDTLRDGAVWGYAAFAFVLFAQLTARPTMLAALLRRYARFNWVFLAAMPVVMAVTWLMGDTIMRWPWADQPVAKGKGGDIMVHLAGIVAFRAAGFAGPASWLWSILLVLNLALVGMMDRSGQLAIGAVLLLCFIRNPRDRTGWRIMLVVAGVIVALWLSGLHVELPGGKGRQLSFDYLITDFRSIASDAGDNGLDSTKEWRLDWWRQINDYTLRGKYFWTGKGFGINLADDDGFQVMDDHSLRSPHSIHMTFLARAGVPGLLLWLAVQMVWAWHLLRAYLHARRHGERRWEGLLFFIGAFWLAFLINGSFDVFIEGPVAGIWFWTVFGLGLAAVSIYCTAPHILDNHENRAGA